MFETLPHSLKRLRLRILRPDDLDAFHAYRSDPVVAKYQGWEPMTTREATALQAALPALRSGATVVFVLGHLPAEVSTEARTA